MVYELLKKIIENPNPYTNLDVIRLQVEFFKDDELKQTEYDELVGMFPKKEEIIVG